MAATPAQTPLRSAKLRRIVAAYTINRLGTWFGFIALSVAVFDNTHSAAAVAAMLLAGQVLPAFLTPAVVARVETSVRQGSLSALYVSEAVVIAALAGLLYWHFSLPAVLVLVALDGIAALAASALLRAAAARCAREWAYVNHGDVVAILPRAKPGLGDVAESDIMLPGATSTPRTDGRDGQAPLVGAQTDPRETGAVEAERRANAAMNVGFAITFTLGPALAGLAIPAIGVPATLLIDVASFLACAAMVLDVRPHVEDAETSSVRARVRAARRYIARAATLRALLITEAVALVFFEFSPPIEVAYAKVSLQAGDVGYGLLLGVWGLGVAIGSALFARSIRRSLAVLLSASTLAVGVAYLGWAVAPSLALACGAGLIGGIGNGVQWAALISAVQRLTPQNLQNRMMGAVESIGAISPGLGLALGGAITALSSPRIAFLVAGVGASLSTIAFMRLPLGGLSSASAVPAAVDEESEWAGDQPRSSVASAS